jgi:hypothetical protein
VVVRRSLQLRSPQQPRRRQLRRPLQSQLQSQLQSLLQSQLQSLLHQLQSLLHQLQSLLHREASLPASESFAFGRLNGNRHLKRMVVFLCPQYLTAFAYNSDEQFMLGVVNGSLERFHTAKITHI